jgi:hypothetical protein
MDEDDYRLLFGKLVRIEWLVIFLAEIICVGIGLVVAYAVERFSARYVGNGLSDMLGFLAFLVACGILRNRVIYHDGK